MLTVGSSETIRDPYPKTDADAADDADDAGISRCIPVLTDLTGDICASGQVQRTLEFARAG